MRPKQFRLTELDALRGIAALMVLLYHFTSIYPRIVAHRELSALPEMTFGYFGVELFFMISGFVVFFSASQAGNWKVFAASRISRLYPAYWASIALVLVVRLPFLDTDKVGDLTRRALVNVSMMQTFLGVDNVAEGYWTLAYEMAFYVLIYAAILLSARRRLAIERILLAWLAAVTVLRLSSVEVPYRLAVGFLIYYGHLFLFGIACYLAWAGRNNATVKALAVWALLMPLFGPGLRTPAAGQQLYAVSVWLCALGFWVAVFIKPAFLRSGVLQHLGAISYSLYLTHGVIGFRLMTIMHGDGVPDAVAFLVATMISLILATAFTFWIERPGTAMLRRWMVHR